MWFFEPRIKKLLVMTKWLFTLLIGMSTSIILAQSVTVTVKVKAGVEYHLTVSKENDEYITTIQSDASGTQKESFTTITLTGALLHTYTEHCYNKFKSTGDPALTTAELTTLRQLLNWTYLDIIAELYPYSEKGQLIANIRLRDGIKVHEITPTKKKDGSQRKNTLWGLRTKDSKSHFDVKFVRIVFEDGFMKSIIVDGEIDNTHYVFSSAFAIGISTRNNVRTLNKYKLKNEHDKSDKHYLVLGEVIDYDRIGENYTNDFSPADDVITLFPGKTQQLFKRASRELFKLRIYSDFNGIDEDNPNGLIQTELSKRINLLTRRRHRMGMFTHMTPHFELSKIEQNNRKVSLSNGTLNGNATDYLSPFEIYRFRNIKTGIELNFFDYQGPVFHVLLNPYFGLTRTIVAHGSPETSTSLNSYLYGANFKLILYPQAEWSLQICDRLVKLGPLNRAFNYHSKGVNDLVAPVNYINSIEMLVTRRLAQGNTVYGRLRFNHELTNGYTNNFEIQVGYSMMLKYSTR